jgi:hypothetical protein
MKVVEELNLPGWVLYPTREEPVAAFPVTARQTECFFLDHF